MSGARGANGFTLLELLLAVALSLLLSLLAYAGLSLGIQGWAGADRQLRQNEERYLTHQLLRRLLESAELERLRDLEGKLQPAFLGSAEGLIYCGELVGLGEPGQRYWLQLVQEQQLVADGAQWRLLLRYRSFQDDQLLDWDLLQQSLLDEGQVEVLLEGLAKPLRFEYLERRPDSEPRWLDEWREQADLPLLLRVSAPQAEPYALELTAAPQEGRHAIVRAR
ncbi:prepilin-type N-terminal cleavage/methylation domain-containing protein [Pseudomonas sp.]|uniref:prepilin-type N-terminal cleavage/methylation domain-containing protein n=1 Tax=Pseudomonas sp. TaxID=306 RepID=UPI0027333E78|nr:prepilin-type N-terminal cleavage/methylation domain-containing protein [Pseudomonas sp.]MDP3814283.1 prepilin-type N-terminal cleavage/methylation domain-containing protein [Pseudomonas sp.]